MDAFFQAFLFYNNFSTKGNETFKFKLIWKLKMGLPKSHDNVKLATCVMEDDALLEYFIALFECANFVF